MGTVEDEVGEFSGFCELPDDLTEEILAWLPVDYLSKFSSVCKKWKALFSSTRFITTQWLETPPNKDPLLMLPAVDFHRDSFAYSSFTDSWKSCRLSLSFLDDTAIAAFSVYNASGAGLFLLGSMFIDSIYVCNPLTGKCFTLPHPGFTNRLIMGIAQEGKDGYKVVVVHRAGPLRVEIYDSREKGWKTAGTLQENLRFHLGVNRRGGLVFPGHGFFCSLVLSHNWEGIVRFNMLEGTCIFVPLPDMLLSSYLVSCGSRILLAAETNNGRGLCSGVRVVIWEYIGDAVPNWELIATMPPTISARGRPLRQLRTLVSCAGIGDCIYFRFQGGFGWKKVAVYNLTKNSWSLLPDCSLRGAENFECRPLFGFTPRLDMKVD